MQAVAGIAWIASSRPTAANQSSSAEPARPRPGGSRRSAGWLRPAQLSPAAGCRHENQPAIGDWPASPRRNSPDDLNGCVPSPRTPEACLDSCSSSLVGLRSFSDPIATGISRPVILATNAIAVVLEPLSLAASQGIKPVGRPWGTWRRSTLRLDSESRWGGCRNTRSGSRVGPVCHHCSTESQW